MSCTKKQYCLFFVQLIAIDLDQIGHAVRTEETLGLICSSKTLNLFMLPNSATI